MASRISSILLAVGTTGGYHGRRVLVLVGSSGKRVVAGDSFRARAFICNNEGGQQSVPAWWW
jgi:hypothetical protein